MNIFVGNLSFAATDLDVRALFEAFGDVANVTIVMEKKGTKSRGFGFVEMPSDEQAHKAIVDLSGKEFMGRPLNVSPVRPKSEEEKNKARELKKLAKIKAKTLPSVVKKPVLQNAWFDQVSNKPNESGYSAYKRGRRTRSFIRRSMEPSKVEVKPWRKFKEGARSWRKPEGGSKPWSKPEGGSKPWRKPEEGSGLRRNSQTRISSWSKPAETAGKAWHKPQRVNDRKGSSSGEINAEGKTGERPKSWWKNRKNAPRQRIRR